MDPVADLMGSTTASLSSGKCGAKVISSEELSLDKTFTKSDSVKNKFFLGLSQCSKLSATF